MDSNIKEDTLFIRGFTIGDWQVRPLAGVLEKNGHQVYLEPKVIEVLVCLARHQKEVVTRDMLLAEVWGKVIVTDDAINRCVSELRTVLGDTDRERTYIRTIRGRGYSLLTPVIPLVESDQNETFPSQEQVSNEPPETHVATAHSTAAANQTDVNHKPWKSGNSMKKISAQLLVTAAIIIILNAVIDRDAVINTGVSVTSEAGSITTADSQPGIPATNTIQSPSTLTSVAVLPFANLSGDPQYEYFSDGLSEDIRNALLTATNMRVAARTSSTVFKNKAMDVREIAAQLNVDALLEGTVRVSDERLRVTTQLTDAHTGYSIWAASFERDLADKVILQSEVAEEIVKQLAPSLENEASIFRADTSNVQAHDFYLLGRHHWHQRTAESLDLAVNYFQQALDLDPDYALAYSGLADALLFQIIYGNRSLDDVKSQAETAIEKALNLEPALAEAHASLGILNENTGDIKAALAAYQKAVELKPQYSMAQMWLGNAWFEFRNPINSHKHYEEALKVDPLHPQVQQNYVHSLMSLGRFDQVLSAIERFSKTGTREKLLMIELEAKLALGRYDEVLQAAVGHTFAGEYKPYTSATVIQALIHLQRFDDAERILSDNMAAMDSGIMVWLQANLAIARRDADKLAELAGNLASPDFKPSHKLTRECADSMNHYLNGMSAYLTQDYQAADTSFRNLTDKPISGPCYLKEPSYELLSLLYHAETRFKLQETDPTGEELLKYARSQLDEFKSMGWNTPSLITTDIVLHLMEDDEAGAIKLAQDMEKNGWQPFGQIRASPLFDEYMASEKLTAEWADMDREYKQVVVQCNTIELAKLGL